MRLLGKILGKQAHEQRLAEKLGHVAHTQPPHQIEPVHFNGPDADVQVAGDFAIGETLRHEPEDLLLPGGQGVRGIPSSGEARLLRS